MRPWLRSRLYFALLVMKFAWYASGVFRGGLKGIVSIFSFFTRASSGIVRPPAHLLFERRLGCAAAGGFVSSCLALAPAIFMSILIDRAIASRSIETIVVLCLGTVALLIIGFALSYAGRQYLIEGWRSVGSVATKLAATKEDEKAVEAIDFVMRSGIAWEATQLLAMPILFIAVFLIHPTLAILVAIIAALIIVFERLGVQSLSQITLGASSMIAASLMAYLAISDVATAGGLVAASLLSIRILSPVSTAARHWSSLVAARSIYDRMRASAGFRALGGEPVHDLAALGHARMVVACNFVVCIVVGALFAIPLPQVVVLQGRSAVDGHIKPVRSSIPGTIEKVYATDGDEVKAGQAVVALDVTAIDVQLSELERQEKIEASALSFGERDYARRSTLVKQQVAATEGLAIKGLKPESELIAIRIRHAEVDSQWTSQSHQIQTNISRLTERKSELSRMKQASVIRAPSSGIIQQTAGIGPKSAVSPADVLMVVVPQSMTIIECLVSAPDRYALRVDDVVDVRIRTARSRFGDGIHAVVSSISADATDKGFYLVRLRTKDPIRAGQEVEALVNIGSGSAASWLYDVVTGSIRRTPR
jgi:multidrug resistance efflux pump